MFPDDAVGTGVGGTSVGVLVGGIVVGDGETRVAIGGTGGVAIGVPHPTKNDTTNVTPIIRRNHSWQFMFCLLLSTRGCRLTATTAWRKTAEAGDAPRRIRDGYGRSGSR